MDVAPLTETEEEVWRAIVRLMILLPRTLNEDLQQGSGISSTHYIVLMHLSESPQQQLRMSELAARAALSPSRMSRVIQQLQAQGLVDRSVAADDARAGIASLTEAGLTVLQGAWPTHLASARTIVFSHLDPHQLQGVAATLARVVEAAQEPLATRGASAPVRSAGEPAQ